LKGSSAAYGGAGRADYSGGAATATISLTGAHDVTAYALSIGGAGGFGGLGEGGAGGVASDTKAAAYSTGAGTASALVTQIGGAGGGSQLKGEDGADSSLDDAVKGSTAGGTLILSQN